MAVDDLVERIKQALFRRRFAYQKTFEGTLGREVLKDLARFCRAHESTFSSDPRLHALAEGRREVWLRIACHLQLPPDELWELYSGRPAKGD